MKSTFALISGAAVAVLLAACGNSGKWTVKGSVADADGSTMYLEAPGVAGWYPVDSVGLKGSGSFAMSMPAPGAPEIYRLRLGEGIIYFPIDSIETVTVNASAANFATEYTLGGSNGAEMFMHVDRRVRQAASADESADSLMKRELSAMMLGDPAGLVSYYIVQKRYADGRPVFDPADRTDLRMIGAVANAYSERYPETPRAGYLRNLFLSNRSVQFPRTTVVSDTLHVDEIPFFDITLYDRDGKQRSLSEVAAANRVVVLNFTAYTSEASPALNLELGKLYDRYHSRGLEVFQVGVDPDQYQWSTSAANLPWVTVYQSPASPASHLTSYNVRSVPAVFVIADGELTDRVPDMESLPAAVSRHF
ncbi:MAG: redoxin domain-containing protein [Muribaculaceae bacterium]|nr:redoxin domain-containing protein [Muribaculaceae bacterium]